MVSGERPNLPPHLSTATPRMYEAIAAYGKTNLFARECVVSGGSAANPVRVRAPPLSSGVRTGYNGMGISFYDGASGRIERTLIVDCAYGGVYIQNVHTPPVVRHNRVGSQAGTRAVIVCAVAPPHESSRVSQVVGCGRDPFMGYESFQREYEQHLCENYCNSNHKFDLGFVGQARHPPAFHPPPHLAVHHPLPHTFSFFVLCIQDYSDPEMIARWERDRANPAPAN